MLIYRKYRLVKSVGRILCTFLGIKGSYIRYVLSSVGATDENLSKILVDRKRKTH